MTDKSDDMISDHNSCPSLDQMIRYKEELLDSHESHSMETHLLGCSMCQEAFELVNPYNVAELSALSASIDKRVNERIAQSAAGSSGFNFNLYMAIAASLVGVLIVAGNLFMNTEVHESKVTTVAIEDTEVDKKQVIEHKGVSESEGELAHEPINELPASVQDSVEIVAERKVEQIGEIADDVVLDPGEIAAMDVAEELSAEVAQSMDIESVPMAEERFLLLP